MPASVVVAPRPRWARRGVVVFLAAVVLGPGSGANAGQVCLPGMGLSCGGGGYSPPPRVSVPSGGGNAGAALGAAGALLGGLGALLDSMPSGPASGCDDFEAQGRQMAEEVKEQNDKSLEELRLPASYSDVALQDSCREVEFLKWKSAAGHRILDYAQANAPACPASINRDQLARGFAEVAEIDSYLQQFTQQCQQYTAQPTVAPVSPVVARPTAASAAPIVAQPTITPVTPVVAQPTVTAVAPVVAQPTIAPLAPSVAQPSTPSIRAVNTPRDFVRDTLNPGMRAHDLADQAQAALAQRDCARAAGLFGEASAAATGVDASTWGEWSRRAREGTLQQCVR